MNGLTPELTVLGLAGLLQAVPYGREAGAAHRQGGSAYARRARDEGRALSGVAARLQRALTNHFEGLVLFTLAVVLVSHAGISTPFTAALAWAYLAGRVLYVPAYAFGWVPWRSVFWFVGFLASLALILRALL